MNLRALAPGKVNLCLFLGPIRERDGRHELVTVFESVSLADELRLEFSAADEVVCPGIEGPNLVGDALAALRRHGFQSPQLRIEIEKRVPVAAGMGGGSADAAALLRLAKLVAPLSDELIVSIAAELGADVPAQLAPGLALGAGAGEVVEPLPPIAPHGFVIVPLEHQLKTPAVFAEADRMKLPRSEAELAGALHRVRAAFAAGAQPPSELLVNDLLPAAVSLCPEIEPALEAVRASGAEHALVCGSGPTVAGLWWGPEAATLAQAAASKLAPKFPRAAPARPVDAQFAELQAG
jgi:4-diphosphocytidyl-2-C-methyl-D-erythritol kinase